MMAMIQGTPISTRIRNLLLGLLREFVFVQPPDAIFESSFLVGIGGPGPYNPLGVGIAIKWWETKRARKAMRAVVRAVRDYMKQHARLDREAVHDAVNNALKSNPLNKRLIELLMQRQPPASLFDAYSVVPPVEVAETVWEAVLVELDAHIDEWVFVYPLNLLTSNTFHFPALGASIISTADRLAFDALQKDTPSLSELSLETGWLSRGAFRLSGDKTPSWLFVRIAGTNTVAFTDGARSAAVMLGTLMSAQRMARPHHAFSRSSAPPNDYGAAFCKRSAATPYQAQACGPLLHPILSGMTIDDAILVKTNDCLEKWRTADVEKRRRAEMSARWINRAAASGEHVRFLFFFFALDALFGERHRVEAGILEGVRVRFPDPDWELKCGKLFDLRSELVHGGTASIEEWNGYEPYVDHFETEPLDDIEELSTVCLINFL